MFVYTAIANEEKKLYGVQFHPEVDLTTSGKQMLKNFLTVAGLHFTYTMASREEDCIEYIKQTAGNHKILVILGELNIILIYRKVILFFQACTNFRKKI